MCKQETAGRPLSPVPVEIQRPPKMLILKNQQGTDFNVQAL